jgi:hypothetical protein
MAKSTLKRNSFFAALSGNERWVRFRQCIVPSVETMNHALSIRVKRLMACEDGVSA